MSLIRSLACLLIMTALSAVPAAFGRDAPRGGISRPAMPMMLMQSGAAQCPANASGLRGTGASVTCYCPASAAQGGSVWGTDTYTDDSAICAAARHAGVIAARGGSVTFTVRPGLGSYDGSVRNGVESSNYDAWGGSFEFSGANAGMPAAAAGAPTSLAACPATASEFRGRKSAISCMCSARATATQGTVWGSDIYTDDSNICRAALHAGVIGRDGGAVRLTPMPGRARYVGNSRNGVSTTLYGSWPGSFTVGK